MSVVPPPARELRSTGRNAWTFRRGKGGALQTGTSAARAEADVKPYGVALINPRASRGKGPLNRW